MSETVPVPVAGEPRGERREVGLVGHFEPQPGGGYMFRTDEKRSPYALVGVDPRLEFPYPGKFLVRGTVGKHAAAKDLCPVEIRGLDSN